MLQANLAIILTFITTLIDELGEAKNLSNTKLIVIALAFITVMFIFNYSAKVEKDEKRFKLGLPPVSSYMNQLKHGINQVNQGINQGIKQVNQGINQGINQVNQGLNHGLNNVNHQINNISKNVTNKIPKAVKIQTIPNNSGNKINTSIPPTNETFLNVNKLHYNNTTKLMSEQFKKLKY